MQVEVTTFAGAQAALKNADLAQGLYDEGALVMADALITLHGEAHAQRRAVEYAVFNRRFFHVYETDIFPRTLEPVLRPYLQQGQADVVELGYRLVMNLTADFAGIDRDADSPQETETLLDLVKTFSTGATLVHSTQDRAAVEKRVRDALKIFEEQFLTKSIARRKAIIEAGQPLPNDVLSQLLSRAEELPLSADVMLREMAFYLQAGAHSTANSTTHALHEIFVWAGADVLRWQQLDDPVFVQRCVHESLRLHPASPVALRKAVHSTQLQSREVREGDRVVIDLHQANRDPDVFGSDAEAFNPERHIAHNVWPFGLTFGLGMHACMGRNLDGGTLPDATGEHHLGIVALLCTRLLAEGARPSATDQAKTDTATSRSNWGYYPIVFEGIA